MIDTLLYHASLVIGPAWTAVAFIAALLLILAGILWTAAFLSTWRASPPVHTERHVYATTTPTAWPDRWRLMRSIALAVLSMLFLALCLFAWSELQ